MNENHENCPVCLEEKNDIAVLRCSVDETLHFICTDCIPNLDQECPICRQDLDPVFTSKNSYNHTKDFAKHLDLYPTFLSGLKCAGVDLFSLELLSKFINEFKEHKLLPFFIFKILQLNYDLEVQADSKLDVLLRRAPAAYAKVIVNSLNNTTLLFRVAKAGPKNLRFPAYKKLLKLIFLTDEAFLVPDQCNMVSRAQNDFPALMPYMIAQAVKKNDHEEAKECYGGASIQYNLLGAIMIAKILDADGDKEESIHFYLMVLSSSAKDSYFLNADCRLFANRKLGATLQDRIDTIIHDIHDLGTIQLALDCLIKLADEIKGNENAQYSIINLANQMLCDENNKPYDNRLITLLKATDLIDLFYKPEAERSFWNFLFTAKSDLQLAEIKNNNNENNKK